MFFKNILPIYALFICFITTFLLFIFIGYSVSDVINLTMPEYRNRSSLVKFSSNYSFLHESRRSDNSSLNTQLDSLTPTQLEERRHQERAFFMETVKAKSIDSLFTSLQWLLLSLIFFIAHWKLYKRASLKESM